MGPKILAEAGPTPSIACGLGNRREKSGRWEDSGKGVALFGEPELEARARSCPCKDTDKQMRSLQSDQRCDVRKQLGEK